jgi:hypothetical protein
MKKRIKIIIGVLLAYSVITTVGLCVLSVREHAKFSAGDRTVERAVENKADYYQMKSFAYSLASAVESGRYDEENADEYASRVARLGYDKEAFLEYVKMILEAE